MKLKCSMIFQVSFKIRPPISRLIKPTASQFAKTTKKEIKDHSWFITKDHKEGLHFNKQIFERVVYPFTLQIYNKFLTYS